MAEKILAKVDYLKPLEDKPYTVVVAEREHYCADVRERFAGILTPERISDDQDILSRYARPDGSGRPLLALFPESLDQVCRLVKLANELQLPIVPASSGTHCYQAATPRTGGIVVDLSAWKKIHKIDHRNRAVRIDPGVTYDQLQTALEPHGLRALTPLLPRKDQSVLTAHVEAHPMLIPEFNYSEPVYTAEIVLPSGEIFRSGAAALGPPELNQTDLIGPWGPGFDWNRLFLRSQGTLGIITWVNVMAEPLPLKEKIFFTACNSIDELTAFTYCVQRKWIGYECFGLNRAALAMMLAERMPADYHTLRQKLPAYVQVFCIGGLKRFPDERIAYQEADFLETASQSGLTPQSTIPGAPQAAAFFSRHLRRCWDREPYWKEAYKGASADIFFITTMNRARAFVTALEAEAAKSRIEADDVGVYVQPIENGRACHLEFTIPYDPHDLGEQERVIAFHQRASRRMYSLGALFTRAYGAWADMVNGGNAVQHQAARMIKELLDPNAIMNPGKLGF